MKRALVAFLAMTFFAGTAQAFEMGGIGTLNLNLATSVSKADMTGNTSATFEREGLFTATDLSAAYMKLFDGFYAKGAVAMRYTDDPALKGADWFDIQRFTVEVGSGLLKGIAGDSYAEMSRYTLGTQGRGVFGIIPAFGFTFKPFAARTASAVPAARYARYSAGVRAQWESGIWNAGANFIHSFDDRGSIEGAPAALSVLRNTVYSVNGSANFGRDLRFDGEFAASKSADETAGGVWKDSSALYLRSVFNVWDVRGTAEFERAGTGFSSIAGFANADRLTYRLALNRQVDDKLKLFFDIERYNDNIDGSKPATLVSTAPRIGCEYYAGAWAANYSFKYIGRHDMASISNNNFVNTIDGFYTLDFMKASGSYENSIYADGKADTSGYASNNLNLTLRFPLKVLESVTLTPSLSGNLGFESVKYLDGADKKDGLNFSRTLRAGFAVAAFSAAELSADYMTGSTDRAQGSGSSRGEFTGSAAVYFNAERTMSLKAEYRKAQFSSADGAGDYGEEVFKGTVELAF